MRKHLSSVILVLIAAAIFVAAFAAAGNVEFGGTDGAATEAIEENHPTYEQWFEPLWAPESTEIESGLFAMQAALGAGVLGYAFGVLKERHKRRQSSADEVVAG